MVIVMAPTATMCWEWLLNNASLEQLPPETARLECALDASKARRGRDYDMTLPPRNSLSPVE